MEKRILEWDFLGIHERKFGVCSRKIQGKLKFGS